MGLKRALKAGVAAAALAAVGASGYSAIAETTVPVKAGLDVRVAQASAFSRIEFHWAGGARAASKRDGQTLTLRFSRDAKPDISALKVFPPKWLRGAEAKSVGGALEIKLLLADDADVKVGQADGAIYVNLFAADPKAKAQAAAPPAPAVAGKAVPEGGVVHVAATAAGTAGLSLRFDWKAPVGAAVFRRGEAVWVVFDAAAGLDLSRVSHPMISKAQVIRTAEVTAVRLVTSAAVQAVGEGQSWTIVLGPSIGEKPVAIPVGRDAEEAPAALSAALAGATKAAWIDDPAVGDRIAVVTALAPSKGLASRREFVELAFLPTAQGLAIETYAPDLAVRIDGEMVKVGRPKGLSLSLPYEAAAKTEAQIGAPQPAALPGLVDFETWSKIGTGGFFARYDTLYAAASEEARLEAEAGGKGDFLKARMALARFLVGSQLNYEAIGFLNALAVSHPTVLGDPEFRGLRGAAKAMIGRYAEADVDFASPVLMGDPSSAMWRGYIAAQGGQWEDARKAFTAGFPALSRFAPELRARFSRTNAEVAVEIGDLSSARTHIAIALDAQPSIKEQLAIRLVQARLMEAEGDDSRALGIYDALSRASTGQIASPAILRATQLRLRTGKTTPKQAIAVFDALRYRWRGDGTELETIRVLGQLYLSMGNYRSALEVWRSASVRMAHLPQAAQLSAEQGAAFRALFLDGLADGLQPIQAVGLFNDFKELTPLGVEGDAMLRRLASRLVDVDLLDQAADLLKYQVENRLEGPAKAQVATNLALIYLMARRPEEALVAINSSRTTVLTNALNNERRIITARALIGLGRFDQALEIIETDKSPDAGELRAEVAWKKRDWPAAGAIYEKTLGERWKNAAALSADEEGKLLRAAVGYSLADDDESLTRLRQRFDPYIAAARAPDALRVALATRQSPMAGMPDFARIAADNDAFAGWVVKMKQRLRDRSPTAVQAQAKTPATAARG